MRITLGTITLESELEITKASLGHYGPFKHSLALGMIVGHAHSHY